MFSTTRNRRRAAFSPSLDALERAQAQVVALKKLDAKTNGQAVLKAYDEAQTALINAANRASLTREGSPVASYTSASAIASHSGTSLQEAQPDGLVHGAP